MLRLQGLVVRARTFVKQHQTWRQIEQSGASQNQSRVTFDHIAQQVSKLSH